VEVAVIVNGQAGYANRVLIESAVRSALFRCALRFHNPTTRDELQNVILSEAARADLIMVCGGDGTLNTAVQPLMLARQHIDRLPPLCALPVGTANDLARELGISSRIEHAARLALEGEVRSIDILEIEGDGKRAYMLTNGGLGIPAITADLANRFRQWVIQAADCKDTKAHWRPALKLGKKVIKKAGHRIYEVLLARELTIWDGTDWRVEIELPGHDKFTTDAPFIMINNQPSLGGNYTLAPLTSNTDGTFNLMLLRSRELLTQARSLLQIRRGLIPDEANCPRYEISECTLRQLPGTTPLTFFGDGEILHKDVSELKIRCLHQGLDVVVKGAA
jgi:diacylglycerol kinase family enzyme